MVQYKGLPIFDIVLTKDSKGIKATSLVEIPAIDSDFLRFSKGQDDLVPNLEFIFSSADEEKREIVGAFLIPNYPIFRNVNGNKFYVNFSKEVISELTSKMLKDGVAGLFTIQHNGIILEEGVEVMEIWVKDSEVDKSVELGLKEPIGSAFMKAKITDDVIWSKIKEFGLNGFSIELDASIKPSEYKFNDNKKNEKSMLEQLFSASIEANGKKLYFNGELKKSTAIFTEVDEKPSVFSGEFMKEDTKYTVENGIVVEVENIQVSIDEKFKRLESNYESLVSKIDTVLASEESLEQARESLRLEREQFELEKQNFNKDKTKVDISLEKQILGSAEGAKSWFNQFQKNKK